MRTFEFKDDKAYKFWRIELAGKLFTVKFGRIGTKGQEQTKDFASEAAAKTAHDKLISEKLQKGYVETTKSKAAPASPREALENALVANPDDLGAHAAYADWLIEQGDPRGEFIQVQLALEDEKKPAKERKKLQKREKELLEKHEREWLGELAGVFANKVWRGGLADLMWNRKAEHAFARGWLSHLGFGLLTGPLARALAGGPEVRLLRSLVVGNVDGANYHQLEDDAGPRELDFPGLKPLIESPNLANLRQLVIGTFYDLREEDFTYNSLSLTDLSGVIPLVARLSRLDGLSLEGQLDHVERLFGMKSLNNLEALQLCFSKEYPLEVLAKNRSLERLRYVMFHPTSSEEPAIKIDGLRALVHSPFLKSLAEVRLHMTTIGDAGCEVIVRSGILKRLKLLDLGFGNITDDGARILAGCPDVRNLELLDLQRNALTRKGIAVLRKVVRVHADEQHDRSDTSYLLVGDMAELGLDVL